MVTETLEFRLWQLNWALNVGGCMRIPCKDCPLEITCANAGVNKDFSLLEEIKKQIKETEQALEKLKWIENLR